MEKTVKVYSTPTCPFCKLAKAFLEDNGINFQNIDVSVDQDAAQQMVDLSGQMGVPVITIGDDFVLGFDKERLKMLLGLGD